ncbi:MAG: glycerol-3-phosphate acyltransferase [Actinobacteria bacterium]|nr:glycerol-3-phosphate acyltransferase [Actinomycetota bacterium]
MLAGIVSGAMAYVLGSLPFSVWVGRVFTGQDIRRSGSGHAGPTNVMRSAGWVAGLLALALDVGKGVAAVRLAQSLSTWMWMPAIAAALAVVGHCWPLFAGFRGGMGMSPAGGALLAAWPLGFALAVGLAALTMLVIRHAARANIAASLLVAPLWALFGADLPLIAVAAAAGIIVAVRSSADWNRVYKELWWDRGSRDSG